MSGNVSHAMPLLEEDLIDVALGNQKADLVVRGGQIVDVYSGGLYRGDVAVKRGRIAAVGEIKDVVGPRTKVVEARNRYVTPGLIDTHVHTYESHVTPTQFARGVIPHGTTAAVTDFYGEGIVAGPKAIKFLLSESRKTPLKIFFMVPWFIGTAYQNPPFGYTRSVTGADVLKMLDWPETHGMTEAFATLFAAKNPRVLRLFRKAREKGKRIYGHGAGITGPEVHAWAAALGHVADHESVAAQEVVEKARSGIMLAARMGSGCPNQPDLMEPIASGKVDPSRMMFCSDIISPIQIARDGHVDNQIRIAIRHGIDPVDAVKMATINAALFMRVEDDMGLVAPGRLADIVLVEDLRTFRPSVVIADGEVVAENGRYVADTQPPPYPSYVLNTVRYKRPIQPEDFDLKFKGNEAKVRVIGANDSIFTKELVMTLKARDGVVRADPENDVIYAGVVERHLKSGLVGKGFIRGWGIRRGAVGTTFNSTRQDLVVVGADKRDMAFLANHIRETGGGLVAVRDGKVLAELKMPVCGILASQPFEDVVKDLEKLYGAVREMGCAFEHPFHVLSFVGTTTFLGDLKLCYKGLVQIWPYPRIVPVFVDGQAKGQ